MRSAVNLALAAALITAAAPALAVDDGPRAYFPVPVGTNNLNLLGIFQNTSNSLDPATAFKGADGNDDPDSKTWLGAGITAGMNFSPAFGVSATFGGIVAGNDPAPDGDGFRFNIRHTF